LGFFSAERGGGAAFVSQIYTAAWLPHLEGVAHAVRCELGAERLVLRLSRNSAAAAAAVGLSDGQLLYGQPLAAPAVLFDENHLTFEAEVLQGQKTGFFLDQRDNRARVEAMAKGARVLNAFSFSVRARSLHPLCVVVVCVWCL